MSGGLLFSSAHIMSKHLGGRVFKSIKLNRSWLCRSLSNNQQPPQVEEPPIPPYVEKHGEDREVKRARLLYQSRKRGMTENGLLLSTFAAKYLDGFDDAELKIYDKLINQPSNDWEIYYWVTGAQPTPAEFESDIMNLLKKHTQNVNKDVRSTQPPLH